MTNKFNSLPHPHSIPPLEGAGAAFHVIALECLRFLWRRLTIDCIKTCGACLRLHIPPFDETMKILLVEDDVDISKVLVRTLERRGFSVKPCFDGSAALRLIKEGSNDLIILDLNIPLVDGLHVLQRIRAQGIDTPVLVLTARGAVGDKVAGLNAGADDYLSKPFDLEELDARIRALLRRKGGADGSSQKCGDLRYERHSGAFYLGDDPLELTPREQALLEMLINNQGRAVKKDRLLQQVFPADKDAQLEAVEVLVYRLRKKIADTRAEIVTLRGLGYLLRAQRDPVKA